MTNTTVYSTVTNGHGDKRAAAAHAANIRRMVQAANRQPCLRGCPEGALCPHGLAEG